MTQEIVDLLFGDLRTASRQLLMNSKHGQVSNEGRMLYLVKHHPGEHMKFYANKLQISMPNMSNLTQKMVEDGLIIRTSDLIDRRKTSISITDKGVELGDKYHKEIRDDFAEKFEVLSKEEQVELISNMKVVIKYLKKVGTNI